MDKGTCIAIIPARSGSKRIENKNIKNFQGQPMIARTIANSIESGIFQKVIVSTDSPNIASVSKGFGAEVYELRPKNLSNDFTSTMDVIKYEIKRLHQLGINPEYVACIYPATPLLGPEILINCFNHLKVSALDFCIPVVRNHVNSERLFTLDKDFRVNEESLLMSSKRTQDYADEYRDAGQFYFGKTSSWEKESTIFSNRTLGIIFPEFLGIDIDTPEDWLHAEFVYAGMNALKFDSSLTSRD
jgi:pseudaminic acid cytidylyltransferase